MVLLIPKEQQFTAGETSLFQVLDVVHMTMKFSTNTDQDIKHNKETYFAVRFMPPSIQLAISKLAGKYEFNHHMSKSTVQQSKSTL